jgi:hypothetical protein
MDSACGTAHLMFAMNNLTYDLNGFIRKKHPEAKKMNFKGCCHYILDNLKDFFKPQDIKRKKTEISGALHISEVIWSCDLDLFYFVPYVDCLCCLALTVGNRQTAREIRYFKCNGESVYDACCRFYC